MKTSTTSRLVSSVRNVGVGLLLLGLLPGKTVAQDYIGAKAGLRQVAERNAKPADKSEPDEQSKLRDELSAFARTVTNLPPADAAKGWLALVDRAEKISSQSGGNFNPQAIPLDAADLLRALPPPAAWKDLAQAITARPAGRGSAKLPETGLRILGATLIGDMAARNHEITNLQASAKDADPQQEYTLNSLLEELRTAELQMANDPDAVLKSLANQASYGSGEFQPLTIPNLVSEVGPERAESFLRKALVTPGLKLSFEAPNDTSRLAQKLALELMDQLKAPQWGLVNSLDSVDLYEALDKHFGAQTNGLAALRGLLASAPDNGPSYDLQNLEKDRAQTYYMLGLISKNRTAEAVAVAKALKHQHRDYYSDEALKIMRNAGYTDVLDDFFHELLSQDPTLPYWNQYVEIAATAGKLDRMLALVRGAIDNPDSDDAHKAALHEILFRALLAAEDVDGALLEARRLIALGATAASNDGSNPGQLGAAIARLGVLLHRPELIDEGLGVAKKWLTNSTPQSAASGENGEVLKSLGETLVEAGRGPEAESLLIDALANATRTGTSSGASSETTFYGYSPYGGSPARSLLAELAAIYFKAGRHQDVLDLLAESPDWGTKDLSGLFEPMTSFMAHGMEVTPLSSAALPVPYLAAASLNALGQKDQAQKITDALLNHAPGLDRGYELLLALEGTNAIPRLDEQFARDKFEERPLIWKAHVLRGQNRLEAAEIIIRQAIAIDPSDGEEGRGDRMRAYAELADIREARGDAKEASFYREIVKAIRLSEDADQFYLAGLLKRALGMYQEGLNHFADAYCIQSRMAIQLAALGKNAEAEEHYRRAYELMPDSFGRVESHCFGCERAFEGERAQGIADKVFTQLVAERPQKPQVHYLLGYLRQQQERYNEALTNFLTAVRLDPDYLNAWVRLAEISRQTLMPPAERDETAFSILRLDPLGRHTSSDFSGVTDLAGLWNAVAATAVSQPPIASDLLPLTASKTAAEKMDSRAASGMAAARLRMVEQLQMRRSDITPASAVGQTPYVHIAGELILRSNSGFGSVD